MADADPTRRRAERELTLANIKSARLTLERLQNELVRLDLLGIPDLVDSEPSDASRATASLSDSESSGKVITPLHLKLTHASVGGRADEEEAF